MRRRLFLGAAAGGLLAGWLPGAAAARPRKGQAVLPEAPATLVTFIDFLIPADELTPAASALDLHRQVWDEARRNAVHQRLVEFGCQWLDAAAPGGFAALDDDAREKLAQWLSGAPWESPHRRFFDLVRDRSMFHYYGRQESWKGLPIERPPQPVGYVPE
jgi:hypothetical protein